MNANYLIPPSLNQLPWQPRLKALVLLAALACQGQLLAVETADADGQRFRVSDPAIAAQISALGGRQLVDYGGFQLWELTAAQAAAVAAGKSDGLEPTSQNVIELNAGHLDTATLSRSAAARPEEDFAGKRLHLIHFIGPIQPAWHQDLIRRGCQVVTYVPQNAYLVYGDASALRQLRASARGAAHVQWEGNYQPEYKFHPKARTAMEQAQQGQPVEDLFAVQLVEDPEANAATIQVLTGLRREWVRQSTLLGYVNLVLRLPPERLAEVAALRDVVSIHPYKKPKKRDERQGQILAGNLVGSEPSGPGYLAWLASKGFTAAQFEASGFVVDVSDSGIDNGSTAPNHPGLHRLGNASLPGRVAYNRLVGSPNLGSTLQACDGHGNLNSHIVAGYNDLLGFPHTDGDGYHYGLGIAPFVRVGSSVIFDPGMFTDPDFAELQSRAYQSGARISCNSWGADLGGGYNSDCQAYDALVRDAQPGGSPFPTSGNQEMVIVFAAGNAGPGVNSVSAPGSAKNIISVGASENVHSLAAAVGGNTSTGSDGCGVDDTEANSADDLIGFSSRGPCDDGRVKPDLVGPGSHITGGVGQQASPGALGTALACFDASGVCALSGSGGTGNPDNFFPLGQQFYTTSSGTSHSTPAVGGGAALLRQYFVNQFWPAPSPAMTKAWLMNSARYLRGLNAGGSLPSNNQGMGAMNLGTAFDGVSRTRRDQLAQDRFTATGQSRTFDYLVQDSSKPLRMTLAWTDAPGATPGNAYKNNLDLTVTLNGQTYRGNVFTNQLSIPGGGADPRNNVESVFLPAGFSGAFTVTVTAANINSDGVPGNADLLDQDFALVSYNAIAPDVALVPASYTVTAESCPPGQGAVDPGETVSVNFTLRNLGPSNTVALVATLLATNGVVNPGAPQNYGVVSGGGGTLSREFTFTTAGACGDLVGAVLQLQDGTNDYGAMQFAIPLGQTAATSTAATNPAAITIAAAGGAVSSYPSEVTIAGADGLTSRVTVTLNGLSHTWADDLDVVLVGPQGQAVLLLSDAGGGNSISGLTLTFDDAAAAPVPNESPLSSGVWKPTNFEPDAPLPAPAPAGPYAATLAALAGTNPNGAWRLFVSDDYPSDDGGTLQSGWSLTVTTTNAVCCLDAASADLSLTMQATPDPINVTSNVTYLLTVANAGPASATDVVVTNALPPQVEFVSATASQGSCVNQSGMVVCSLGTLPSGGTALIRIVARATTGPELESVATLTASQTDFNPANNVATTLTSVNVPFVSAQDTSLAEGDAGRRTMVFLVTLSQAAIQPVTVEYATIDGTAAPGLDYLPQTNRLQLAPGEIAKTVEIPVLGDRLDEDDESVRLVLFHPAGGSLARAEAVGLIVDDDPMPSVSIGNASTQEGQSGTTGMEFPLTLSTASGRAVTVSGSTSNGTALAGQDFVSLAQRRVTFLPGQVATNVSVLVLGDPQIEPDETFFVQLSSSSNAVVAGSSAQGTIVTDDIGPLVVLASYRLTAESKSPPNGIVDAGETVTISLALRNTGSTDTTNLVVTLQSGNGVSAPSGPQNYGSLAASGPTVSRPYTFTAAVTNCGAMRLQFQLQNGPANLGTQTLVLVAGDCFVDDFDPAIDLFQWSSFGGSVGSTILATNYGESVSGNNSLWFGASGSRYATSRPLNTTLGGTVSFYLRLSDGTDPGQWEAADLPDEGVVLEYSIDDGENWSELGRYDTSQFTSWTSVRTELPLAAQAPATRFRWRQLANSGSCCDHWALDNVEVFTGPRPPEIELSPASVTVVPGTNVTLCVTARGAQPLSYQWRKDGTNLVDGARLAGTTTRCLTITGTVEEDSGGYSVLVTNTYGSVASSDATLLVSWLHHFAWGNITSPKGVNVPFPATLTAQNAQNQVVTNFNACVALSVVSGKTNTVGAGTLTNDFPMGAFYHDQRTQVIYLPAEVGGAGRITALALDVATRPGQTLNRWTIRMKHTGLSGYSSYDWESTGWTVVLQTNLTVSGTGWVLFNLTTPFNYNGVSSLMIDFSFNNSSFSTDGICRATTRTGLARTLHNVSDSFDGDPLNWAGTTPFPLSSSATPNLRLVTGFPVTMEPAFACLTNGYWTGPVVIQTLASNLMLRASTEDGFMGLSNPFYTTRTDDLSLAATASAEPAQLEVPFTYALVVANSGPSPATDVWLTNTLPTELVLLSAQLTQGTGVASGNRLTCNLGVVPAGATATVVLTVFPGTLGTFTNLATVRRLEADGDLVNNTAALVTHVVPQSLPVAFSAPGLVSIPSSGAAIPYPSTIIVSQLVGSVQKVTATLSNLSHAYSDDLDILLVGPAGQTVMLMSDVGGSYEVSGVNLTFDQTAASQLPDAAQIVSGTYRPTDFATGDILAAPAPAGPYGTDLSVFVGVNPNGTWRLFVYDDSDGDSGTIANGWSLRFSVPTAPAPMLLPPTVSGGQIILRIPTVVGVSYTVEFKTALTDPAWATLQTITGDGTLQTVTDSAQASPQRYYRVRSP